MGRLVAFVAVLLLVVIGAFAWVTAKRPSPARARAGDSLVVVPVVPGAADPRIAAARTTAADMRVVAFLRSTLTMAEMLRAERGDYPSDPKVLAPERPANVSLHVVRVGSAGLRLTAIDHPRQRQCDVFAGDSALWAFGYAFDPRVPACGKIR